MNSADHIIILLGECSTLRGERERGSVVGVYVSSHRRLTLAQLFMY